MLRPIRRNKIPDGWQDYSCDGSFLGKDTDQTNHALHRLSDYDHFPEPVRKQDATHQVNIEVQSPGFMRTGSVHIPIRHHEDPCESVASKPLAPIRGTRKERRDSHQTIPKHVPRYVIRLEVNFAKLEIVTGMQGF